MKNLISLWFVLFTIHILPVGLNAQTGQKPELVLQDSNPRAAHITAFSTDGKFLATGDSEGIVSVWSAESGKQVINSTKLVCQDFHENPCISDLQFSPEGHNLFITTSEGSFIWSFGMDKIVQIANFENQNDEFALKQVIFSYDGKYIAGISGYDSRKYFGVFDTESGKEIFLPKAKNEFSDEVEPSFDVTLLAIAFTSDGRFLISLHSNEPEASKFNLIRKVWNFRTQELVRKTEYQIAAFEAIEFTKNGKSFVAFNDNEKSLRIYESASMRFLRDFQKPINPGDDLPDSQMWSGFGNLQMSVEGNYIVSQDGTQVFDTRNGTATETKIECGVPGIVKRVGVAPKGEKIACNGVILRLSDGKKLELSGKPAQLVRALAVADSKLIAGGQNAIVFWNLSTGLVEQTAETPIFDVTQLIALNDGNYLAMGDGGLSVIDPKKNEIIKSIKIVGAKPTLFAIDKSQKWVAINNLNSSSKCNSKSRG